MNPLEKAEVSGIASGATMEGLDLALGTEEEWPPTEGVEDLAVGEVEVKMDGKGRHFRIQQLTKVQQDSCAGCNDGDAKYLIQCRYHDLHPNDFGDLIYCTDCLMDNVVETEGFMCGDCEDEFASEEPPEKDDPLESWMEDYDAEEPSAYDFVKEEILKASPMNESEVNHFLDKLSNVPMSYLKEARSEAIKLQDESAKVILTMAINRRSFREEWASEECNTEGCENEAGYYDKAKTKPIEEGICIDCFMRPSDPEAATELRMMKRWSSEDDYVEMMACPFCEEFGDGQIPTGVDIDSGDRWSPPTADITGWEMCEYCEGKGEVEDTPENQSIPTWDWDYLIPDEPDYDRYEDRYDDWDAESNGDKQLELAVKRTKMSMIRTGLAITTFGIVLWNLWTNKKQEKQISDIMGLV